MGFDIKKLTLRQRATRTAPRDADIKANCLICEYRDICGGFWIWDDSRWCDRDCGNCPAFCCQKSQWFGEARRLGGLGFDDVKWVSWSMDWPQIVWVIGGRTGHLPEPVYMIPVDSLINRVTLRWAKTRDLRERFSIPADSKVGISFCFRDWLLDRFKTDESAVYDALEGFDVDFVMPINYSAYRNFPRLDQLIAMRRRMLSMAEMQRRGMRVVPDIGMVRPVDVDRWSKWVLDNGCKTVFVTVQTMRGKRANPTYRIQLDNLSAFRRKVGDDTTILIQGASAKSMAFLKSQLGKVCFINHAAWVKAELRIHAVTGGRLRDRGYSVQDTFALNVLALRDML